MNEFNFLKYPVATEKAIKILEEENKLVFIVSLNSTKQQIKEAVEKALKVKVKKIRTLVRPQGDKKAYITLSKDTPAIDIATELGLV